MMRKILSVLLLLFTTTASAGRLGEPIAANAAFDKSHTQRELQSPASVVLNALVETFLPAVVDDLETNIAQDLDPLPLGIDFEEEVQVVITANDTTCLNVSTPATTDVTAVERTIVGDDDASDAVYKGVITYAIGNMEGMGTMDIQSVKLVDGSQTINIPALALFGAQGSTWSGSWDALANFDKFVLQTTATLNMTDFCNTTSYTETETGTFTIWKPSVTMTIYVEGETDNIYRFNEESVVKVATVQTLTITYQNITGGLKEFDDFALVDPNEPFITTFEKEFKALIGYVQEEVDKEIPFSL